MRWRRRCDSDPDVFLIGEEVAEYQGAYKCEARVCWRSSAPRRVIDTPITEAGFAGLAVGAAFAGLKPIVEFMTFNFAMAGHRPDHQFSPPRRATCRADRWAARSCSAGPAGRPHRWAAQHSQSYAAWYAHVPGLRVISPYDAADAKGASQGGDPRSQSGRLSRERDPLRPEVSGTAGRRPRRADRPRPASCAPGKRRDGGRPFDRRRLGRSRRRRRSPARASMPKSSTCARCGGRSTSTPSWRRSPRPTGVVVVEEGWPVCGIASELSARIMERGFDDLDAPVMRVTDKGRAHCPMPPTSRRWRCRASRRSPRRGARGLLPRLGGDRSWTHTARRRASRLLQPGAPDIVWAGDRIAGRHGRSSPAPHAVPAPPLFRGDKLRGGGEGREGR